jgi:hypothetical protein
MSFPSVSLADQIVHPQIIDAIRHSVAVLRDLDPATQDVARRVYFDALRWTFLASTAWAGVALLAALFAKGQRLDRNGRGGRRE